VLFRQVTHGDLGCASREVIHVADGGVGTWAREGHPIER
jgi:hypothetical protein